MIAVCGKGGTGKTTTSALIVRQLLKDGKKPILAIDADPNANLADSLGMTVERTVGSTIAEFFDAKLSLPAGMTKESYLELKLNQMLVEGEGVDLLVMGRGEGPGCYCFPNLMIRKFQDSLAKSYEFVVVDNEAGMEHLSRRTTEAIDCLLVVADPSAKGIRTAARIRDLVAEVEINVKKQYLVVNSLQGRDETEEAVAERAARHSLEVEMVIPYDANVYDYDADEKPVRQLPDDSAAVKSVRELVARMVE